jgi:hypothetical protein
MLPYVVDNPFSFNTLQGRAHLNNILKVGYYVPGYTSHIHYKDQSVNDK